MTNGVNEIKEISNNNNKSVYVRIFHSLTPHRTPATKQKFAIKQKGQNNNK